MDESSPAHNDAPSAPEEMLLEGLGTAPGIAIGRAYLYTRASDEVEQQRISEGEVESEIELFEEAVRRAEFDLDRVIAITREKLGDDSAAIFEAQRMMLRDEELLQPVRTIIREQQANAGHAVKSVMSAHRQRIEASDDEYLRERANDLTDVQDRIIRHLRRGKLATDVGDDAIVIAENLGAADVIRFNHRGVLGCVSEHGGVTSHVAIIARAVGMPSATAVPDATNGVPNGAQVLLDGHHGRLIVHPTEETLAFYRERQRRYEKLLKSDQELVPLPSETQDGVPVSLQANIEFKQELDLVEQYGAEGIGLVRTEMLFLMRRDVSLSESKQLNCYAEFIDAVAPHQVTFRLLDFGGDKMLPLAHREHNPFLGWRGMRVLLDRPELLRPQVRALLRAGADGSARILLPMITHLDEVHAFYEVLENVKAELERDGIPYDPDPPVGIMVEVPAVALQAGLFAQAVDFLSIGTNDLTQYVLAVDRGNDRVAHRYDAFHPAVLQLIRRTIEAAQKESIPVSLCGKMGANPKATPLLIGLGLDTISASPSFLPPVKRVVRAIRRVEALELAEAALLAPGPEAVHQRVDAWFDEYAPEALAIDHPRAPSQAAHSPD